MTIDTMYVCVRWGDGFYAHNNTKPYRSETRRWVQRQSPE